MYTISSRNNTYIFTLRMVSDRKFNKIGSFKISKLKILSTFLNNRKKTKKKFRNNKNFYTKLMNYIYRNFTLIIKLITKIIVGSVKTLENLIQCST